MQKTDETAKKIASVIAETLSKEFGGEVEIVGIGEIDIELNDDESKKECEEQNNPADCEDCDNCDDECKDDGIVISPDNVITLLSLMHDIDEAKGFENKYTAAMKFVGGVDAVFNTSPSILEFFNVLGKMTDMEG